MKPLTPEQGRSALSDDAERNRLLAEMAEQSTDMISRHTPGDWRFIYASPAVTHLLGFTVEEIVGMSAYDLYHPDDVQDFQDRAPSVTYDRGLYTHTYRFRCKDGHYTWLESTSRTLRDPETNEIKEILVVSRDASHRIKADKANRRLARVLESTQDLVIFSDLDLQITHLNEAARRCLALEHTDYTRLSLQAVMVQKGFQILLADGLPTAKEKGSWRGEMNLQPSKGSPIPVMLELLMHRSLHGDIEYLSLVARNLSEKKAAEAQMKQYQAEIDHASRLITMGELASSLAHELNQPLLAMVSFLRGIERRFASAESLNWQDIETPITRSISTALRAGEIVHRMMDFTRKQEPRVTELDIASLVNGICEFYESTAERHNVRVICQLDDNLPTVCGDQIQLEQVLLNLLVNALEACDTGAGHELKTVRVVVRPEGDQLLIIVEDEGPGIREKDLPHIFERFYSTKGTGLGMGLAISRSLVENLGGELWAENLPQSGTRFSFTVNTVK
ncbi:PAS domain-containing sensor histidine kinase [Marinobacterium halophilum]|nr:ATP-binding protein [Marinobacterium halophilum]